MAKPDYDGQVEILNQRIEEDSAALAKIEAEINRRRRSLANLSSMRGALRSIRLEHTGAADYFCQAVECFEAVTDRDENRDEAQLATYLTEWGLATQQSGDRDTAELALTRALNIREEVLGPEHPDTVESRANLALLDSK